MTAPLRWPEHFPPSTGVERFFIGVRWLGPDLSFFQALRALQASRDRSSQSAWGNDVERRKLVRFFSAFLHRYVRWPGRYFIPEDALATCLYGPKFDMMDNHAYEVLQKRMLERFDLALGDAELERLAKGSLADVVDYVAASRKGARRRA
jgi:hypothetical protein